MVKGAISAAAKRDCDVLCYNISARAGYFGGDHSVLVKEAQREAIITEFPQFKQSNPGSKLKLYLTSGPDDKHIMEAKSRELGVESDVFISIGVDKDKAAAYFAEQGLSVAVTIASDPLVMLGPLGSGIWVEDAPYASDEEKQASYCFDRECFNAAWEAWNVVDAQGVMQKVVPAQFMHRAYSGHVEGAHPGHVEGDLVEQLSSIIADVDTSEPITKNGYTFWWDPAYSQLGIQKKGDYEARNPNNKIQIQMDESGNVTGVRIDNVPQTSAGIPDQYSSKIAALSDAF